MNPNSALLWLPNIQAAGLPVPRTIVEHYSHAECLSIFEGKRSEAFERLISVLRHGCESIGYPCFLRTDLGSAKHAGPSAYLVLNPLDVHAVAYRTIEDQEMKFWLEKEGPAGITYGWKPDPDTLFGERESWVLYVDLPQHGQVSFHSPNRGKGPDYPGDWDGQRKSVERILEVCDVVYQRAEVSVCIHPDLTGRPGLRTESPATNALARELHQLAVRNGLRGCVLISFTDVRVGVNSCGEPDSLGIEMERLGDRILAAIDDGVFDPAGGR